MLPGIWRHLVGKANLWTTCNDRNNLTENDILMKPSESFNNFSLNCCKYFEALKNWSCYGSMFMFEISNHRPLRELWSRILCFAIIRVRIDKLGRFLDKIKCLYSETNYFVKPRNYFPRICLDCLSLHLVFRSKAILNFLEKGLNELLRHFETEFVPSDVS